MQLPNAVSDKIRRTWGDQGAEWIERFPQTLQKACDRWSLSEVRPFPNLSYHFVASARMTDRDVVLKLGVPVHEFLHEAAALNAFGNKKCVSLIDHSADLAATILERVVPGESLESLWTIESDDLCTETIARCMLELSDSAPDREFPSVLNWALALESKLEIVPKELLDLALQLVNELESQSSERRLLHGDLHHGNVLRSESSHKVIDPKGVIGDPAFECYALLRNPVNAPVEFTFRQWERRLEIVTAVTGLDHDRLLRGAFCGTMISCCWSCEEGELPPALDLELARRLAAAIC